MGRKVTFGSLRKMLIHRLQNGIATHEIEMVIRMLIEHHTGLAWHHWKGQPQLEIDDIQKKNIEDDAEKLLSGKPIQYILKSAHFYGRDFYVTPDVLIPRRETEEMMVWVRDSIIKEVTPTRSMQLIDIGTGSGCIAISLACESSESDFQLHIIATDISRQALAIAEKNARQAGVFIEWIHADIFEMAESDFSNLDIIVSNPPYVKVSERFEMEPRVTDYEPGLALFVPDEDPLRFYRQISMLARHWLRPGGLLFFEINEGLGREMTDLLHDFGFTEIILKKDMQGKDRMIRSRVI